MKIGSNQFKTKNYNWLGVSKKTYSSVLWLTLLVLILGWAFWYLYEPTPLISPVMENYPSGTLGTLRIVKQVSAQTVIDEYVDEASLKFGKGKEGYSSMKSTLHCLLHRESRHTFNKGIGDNGLAEGPMQFHQATWVRMRKQMLNKDLIKEISDRYNTRDAIYTTAWAISNGRGRE